MRYSYTHLFESADPASGRRVPLVKVTLHSDDGAQVSVLSLVDSGADVCVFHVAYAGALGIDLEQCERALVRGVGGVGYDIYKTDDPKGSRHAPKDKRSP